MDSAKAESSRDRFTADQGPIMTTDTSGLTAERNQRSTLVLVKIAPKVDKS
jgi:hypothetical protein